MIFIACYFSIPHIHTMNIESGQWVCIQICTHVQIHTHISCYVIHIHVYTLLHHKTWHLRSYIFQNGYQECAELILRQFPTELDYLITLSCGQKISEDKVSLSLTRYTVIVQPLQNTSTTCLYMHYGSLCLLYWSLCMLLGELVLGT